MDNLNDELSNKAQDQPSFLGAVARVFYVDDSVVYKPFENCRNMDISGIGIIRADLGDGMYRVAFGCSSFYGIRIRDYNWSNLWAVKNEQNPIK